MCVAGKQSDVFPLEFGVPQGSIIGPKAFIMYSQPVAQIIRFHGIKFHIYADDIQLYITFNPQIPGEAAVATYRLTSCVADIRRWMTENKLKLNDSKTEFFISASQKNMSKLSHINIRIGNETISPSNTIKNLGVTFDPSMTMSSHITSLCQSINFNLRNISRIRRFIDKESCAHAMRALILSRLDYANSLLAGCRGSDITRLQRLQNRAARIIFQVPCRHSSSPLLQSLHWLPIEKRIIFKILLYVYKSLHGLTPTYLSDSISLHKPSRQGLRSAMDATRLMVPPRSRRMVGERAFPICAPKLWNDLPSTIRSASSPQTFKRQLKTQLFV